MLEFYPGRPRHSGPPVPTKIAAIALAILIATTIASADTVRVKVKPSNGELVPFDRPPCDAAARARLWRIVSLQPMIEIVDDRMTFVVGHKRKDADAEPTLSDFTYWNDAKGFVKLTSYGATFQRPNDVQIRISVLKSATVTRPRAVESVLSTTRTRESRADLGGMRGTSISFTSNGCTVTWAGLGEEI